MTLAPPKEPWPSGGAIWVLVRLGAVGLGCDSLGLCHRRGGWDREWRSGLGPSGGLGVAPLSAHFCFFSQ